MSVFIVTNVVWGLSRIPAEKTLEPLGFQPALYFDHVTFAGIHLMRVRGSAHRDLASDASSVVGASPGLMLRASHPRRH